MEMSPCAVFCHLSDLEDHLSFFELIRSLRYNIKSSETEKKRFLLTG